MTLTGVDRYGNPVHDLATRADLSSDHPSDVISGMSVFFPSASTHVITATLRSNPAVSGSASISVAPAAVGGIGGIALTGVDPTEAFALAGVLLALGTAAVLAARGRRRSAAG